MQPRVVANGAYAYTVPRAGYTVALTVDASGAAMATTTVRRTVANAGVSTHDERPAVVGFYGEYFSPADTRVPKPAVLSFGGSEGGLAGQIGYIQGELLASRGYPTLRVAYFGEPGLPRTLTNIPLEYFANALTWLRAQLGVDPSRIIVNGLSRGSEAALLLGVNFPSLVHAVIALVPSNVALCGLDFTALPCSRPAWTLRGAPVPYTRVFNDPHPPDLDAAVIPVEQIRGPILLDCGGRDAVWNSCAFGKAIIHRLDDASDRYSHRLYEYPETGHGIGDPFLTFLPNYAPQLGGGAAAQAAARADMWRHVLEFVSSM